MASAPAHPIPKLAPEVVSSEEEPAEESEESEVEGSDEESEEEVDDGADADADSDADDEDDGDEEEEEEATEPVMGRQFEHVSLKPEDFVLEEEESRAWSRLPPGEKPTLVHIDGRKGAAFASVPFNSEDFDIVSAGDDEVEALDNGTLSPVTHFLDYWCGAETTGDASDQQEQALLDIILITDESDRDDDSDDDYNYEADVAAGRPKVDATSSKRRGSRKRQRAMSVTSTSAPNSAPNSAPEDGNEDNCFLCDEDGLLVCCDRCPRAYHGECAGLKMDAYGDPIVPEGEWLCPDCEDEADELVSVCVCVLY